MESPGPSFLMNLTGNSAVSLAGGAPGRSKESSDSSAFNDLFTSHAGLAAGDASGAEGDIQALMNSASTSFFGDFDLTGTGFGVNAPENLTINPEIDAASDVPGAETLLVQHGSDRQLRGDRVSDGGIERIDRLDTPNRSEHVRGRTRPDFSVGLRAVKNDAPAIAQHTEITQIDGDQPGLRAFPNEQNDVGAIKNRTPADIFTIAQQKFAPVPAAPQVELNFGKTTSGLVSQFEQLSPRDIGFEPEIGIEARPAKNQNLPFEKTQPFDVATLTALALARTKQVTEPSMEAAIRDSARDPVLSHRIPNAVIAASPNTSTAVPALTNEAKRQIVPVNQEVLLDFESSDPASDEQRYFEPRFASRIEAGGLAPTISTAAPVTMSAIAAAPVMAERLASDENNSALMIEADGFAQIHSSGERAPIQFAPPTTLPPAGAAWAQVISAISERNGETKLELRLNPPELGRVTIAFEGDGVDIVRAVVSADSQQTLDLMRRNIDILQRELARAGLDNINVELADRGAHSQSHDDTVEQTVAYASIDDKAEQLNNNIPLTPLVADGRLDLRV